jgi:hypothetical protein
MKSIYRQYDIKDKIIQMDEDKYRVSMDIRELRILLLGVAITSSVSTLLGVALVRWLFA